MTFTLSNQRQVEGIIAEQALKAAREFLKGSNQ